MQSFVVRALVLLLVSGTAMAVEPWQKELARSLVKVEPGRMIFEEVELCTVPADAGTADSRSLQVRTRGEAPAGTFISRDYFVALMAVMVGSIDEDEELDCKPLASPIGNPDVEIAVRMTKDGVQVESKDNRTGQSDTVTNRWQDLVAE